MARRPNNPENELKVQWSKREDDFVIFYDKKTSGHLMYQFLTKKMMNFLPKSCANEEYGDKIIEEIQSYAVIEGKSLVQELEDRGYDLTTLKFTIKKKDA